MKKRKRVAQRAFLRCSFFVKSWGKLGHNFCNKKECVAKCPVVRGLEKTVLENYKKKFFSSPLLFFFLPCGERMKRITAEVFVLLKEVFSQPL